jgi:hypothetical protein
MSGVLRRLELLERKVPESLGLRVFSDQEIDGVLQAWRRGWRTGAVAPAEAELLERHNFVAGGKPLPAETLWADKSDLDYVAEAERVFAAMDQEDEERAAFRARPDIAAAIAANEAAALVCRCNAFYSLNGHLRTAACPGGVNQGKDHEC